MMLNSKLNSIGYANNTIQQLFVYPIFYDKEWNSIVQYRDLFHTTYNDEDVRYIPNMQQNYKYLNSEKSNGQLVDIICGNDNKIVFVWKKSKQIDELYRLWCDRAL